MSLVANYSSGSESDSDHEQQKSSTKIRSFANSLPPPKRKVDATTGKVQIYVDLPPKIDDSELDTTLADSAPNIKRQKTSTGGSGLLASLLPAPMNKNPSIKKEQKSQTPSTTFIPPALAKRKAELEAAKAKALSKNESQDNFRSSGKVKAVEVENEEEENEEESDDEPAGEMTSFFPLGPNITQVSTSSKDMEPPSMTDQQTEYKESPEAEASNVTYTAADAYAYYDPNMHYDPAAYQQWYEQQAAYAQYEQDSNAQEDQLSGEALEKLMGRHGRGMGDNINIKTVNLAEELQNQDGIPTQEPIRHSGSSIKTNAMQKRKSNLMYLAFQAQDRRDLLAEQHAQNRKTKREAKMKYGF